MPNSYVSLPISLGAKAVLMHLCCAANRSGESWWSYEDIAAAIGRSKPSVTAYVRELIDFGLIEAFQQRMANGYNYTRRLKVVQWRDLLSHWAKLAENGKSRKNNEKHIETEHRAAEYSVTDARSSVLSEDVSDAAEGGSMVAPAPESTHSTKPLERKTECSVQPAECKNPSGSNKTQKNNTTPRSTELTWTPQDEMEWRRFRPNDSDPLGSGNGLPSPALLKRLEASAAGLAQRAALMNPESARQNAAALLADFMREKHLRADEKALTAATEALGQFRTRTSQQDLIKQLSMLWQSHWKNLPTPAQIKRLKLAQPVGEEAEVRRLLGQANQRLWHARMALQRAGQTSSSGTQDRMNEAFLAA